MGASNSNNYYTEGEIRGKRNIYELYQKREDINDERYGNVQIFNHKHNPHELILFKEKWTNTDSESVQLNRFIKDRSRINHPNIAQLKYYNLFEDKQWCSSFYKHQMGFEFYNRNLAKELHERKHVIDEGDYMHDSTKFFSEPEVWYIIDSLCSVVQTFRQNGYHHGDIQPKNILIDEQGFLKLLDNSLVNYGYTGYQKMLSDPRYESALSPLLMEAMRIRATDPIHTKVKSDLFSVGITALCAATNTNINHYYDWRQKRVRMRYPPDVEEKMSREGFQPVQDTVGEDLERMRTIGYSEQLIGVIAGLLQYHERDRIGVDELRGFIAKHQSEIGYAAPAPQQPGYASRAPGVPPQGGYLSRPPVM